MPRKRRPAEDISELTVQFIEQPQPVFPGRDRHKILQGTLMLGNLWMGLIMVQILPGTADARIRQMLPMLKRYAEDFGLSDFRKAGPYLQPLLRYRGRDYMALEGSSTRPSSSESRERRRYIPQADSPCHRRRAGSLPW